MASFIGDAIYTILLLSFVSLAIFGLAAAIGLIQTDWMDDSIFAFLVGSVGTLVLVSVVRLM